MSVYSISSSKLPQGTLTPMNTLLFAASEPGAWYDPSDLSTLFQDSAGTTPVTAVEQPVGRILDKSGRGNHASQATTTKRPVLSRRVNLLTKTEEMTPFFVVGVGWTHGAFGNWILPLDLGAQIAPDGTNTAVGIRSVGIYGSSTSVQRVNVAPGASIVFRVWVRKVEGEDQSGLAGLRLIFQTGNNGALVDPYAASVGIGESVTDDWQQFEFSYTTPATGVNQVEVGIWFASVSAAAVAVWGASLTLATDAHLPYQRINTETDYDADPAKFPAYLRFDGVDDAMVTVGNVDFSGTDKVTAVAGISRYRSSGTQYIVSNLNGQTTPMFVLYSSDEQSVLYLNTSGQLDGVAGPSRSSFSGVLTGVIGDKMYLRENGEALVANRVGSAALGSVQLHLGQIYYGGSYLNGRLYSLIVRGAQSNLSQIEATELYVKQKMRLP